MNTNTIPTQIEKKIVDLVTVTVGNKISGPLTLDTEILESKLLDSFGILQLILEIEQEFNININTEDMTTENFSTISSIADLIKNYQYK